MKLEALDEGARKVGQAYMYWKMFVAALMIVLFSVLSVVVSRIRRGWVTGRRNILTISCKQESETDCVTEKDGTRTCNRKKINACDIKVRDFDGTLTKNYAATKTPKAGDDVAVYYDPLRENETMTLTSFPKYILLTLFVLVALGNVVWLIFLYKMRANKMAQRVGAASFVEGFI